MKLFSVDGPLYNFFSRLLDMIKLNILWFLFSLPIVTIGASTVAAFSITLKMIDEREGYIAKQFWTAFKSNLKQGIPAGILNLFFAYALYLDFQLFHAVEGNPIYFLILGIVGCVMCFCYFIYAYALMARYDNTLLKTLKNSMDISVKYFGRTVMIAVVVAIEIIVFMFNTTTMFLGLLICPAVIFLTISGPAMYIFRDIERKSKEG
ncbi:MAG: YesL family protein [Lachnospiraceae bacterium]|nr:YesL family protein [Lachnospiraceae bacterium]MBP3570170.1 YesL family protein [Lachnospiraceae bacterium]